MRRAFIILLLLVSPVLAQEKPGRWTTAAKVAEDVLSAWKAKDEAKVRRFAEIEIPDPWFIVDELLLRGEVDAALAFASGAPRPDTEALPAYVKGWKDAPGSEIVRKALKASREALARDDPEAALAALADVRLDRMDVLSVSVQCYRAAALWNLKRRAECIEAYDATAASAEELSWLAFASKALRNAASYAYQVGDLEGSRDRLLHLTVLAEKRRHFGAIVQALENLGEVYLRLNNYSKSVETQTRLLGIYKRAGDLVGQVRCTILIGNTYKQQGEYQEAVEAFEQSIVFLEELGDLDGVAGCLQNISATRQDQGDAAGSLEPTRRAIEIYEKIGEEVGLGRALVTLGNAYRILGELSKGLAEAGRGLKLLERAGDDYGVAAAIGILGGLHTSLGHYSEAVKYHERYLTLARKIDHPQMIAAALAGLGIVRVKMGQPGKALELQLAALEVRKKIGRTGVAHAHQSIGGTYSSLLDFEKAFAHAEQARRVFGEQGDRLGVASCHSSIGSIHRHRREFSLARVEFEKALAIAEEEGGLTSIAQYSTNLADVLRLLGEPAKAAELARHAIEVARRFQGVSHETGALCALAQAEFDLGNLGSAAKAARLSVEGLSDMAGRLPDEWTVSSREMWPELFETGIRVCTAMSDAEGLLYFLESGRASGLLSSLGGRDALAEALVSEDLRMAEATARGLEAMAQEAYRKARKEGRREVLKVRQAELMTARKQVARAIGRIQTEEIAGAGVVYPEPATLEEVRGSLNKGEALVLYFVGDETAVALVVTGKDARIVQLTEPGKIDLVSRSLLAAPGNAGLAKRLRGLVVEPLGLGKEVRTLLVSPHGKLGYVPFSLLAAFREVVFVPSATAHCGLVGVQTARGRDVLALGDPWLGEGGAPRDADAMRSDVDLGPLPAAGAEARALGDLVLTGKEATESALLSAIGKRERWRAVHFACHGIVNPESPLRSSLVLAGDEKNDGYLTALDLFRMKIPADLVVLSACETAKGKIYRSEGIVGLTRAFMMAGAPRVVCSLWKVDDEATRALMVKFYELWNPKEGEGLPAARALKEAQDYIKGHEKWKHPIYWAAWVLWGLPD